MEVEDMEEFVGEFVEASEIDLDYEFDASQFHDFIRGETNSEAREAERWFETAANHPPSRMRLFSSILFAFLIVVRSCIIVIEHRIIRKPSFLPEICLASVQ